MRVELTSCRVLSYTLTRLVDINLIIFCRSSPVQSCLLGTCVTPSEICLQSHRSHAQNDASISIHRHVSPSCFPVPSTYSVCLSPAPAPPTLLARSLAILAHLDSESWSIAHFHLHLHNDTPHKAAQCLPPMRCRTSVDGIAEQAMSLPIQELLALTAPRLHRTTLGPMQAFSAC